MNPLNPKVSLFVLALTLSGCVSTGTHDAALKDLADTQGQLKSSQDESAQLSSKIAEMDKSFQDLLGQKVKLSEEKESLAAGQTQLSREIAECKRMSDAANSRNNEFKKILTDLREKLQKMISAGTLQIKSRNGMMIVQLSSDVVFPAGSTRIKPEAKEAIVQLAESIKGLTDRRFLVVGHSDDTPIATKRFPSNWELSSQRAIEVIKLMIENGVPSQMLDAAGQAEFDPLVPNDSPDNKRMNRRVEIVFLPKIDELPGMGEIFKQ